MIFKEGTDSFLIVLMHYCYSHGRDGYVRTWQCSEGRSEVVNSMTAPFLGFCQFGILPRGQKSIQMITLTLGLFARSNNR